VVFARAYKVMGGVAVEVFQHGGDENALQTNSRSLFNGVRNGVVLAVAEEDLDSDVANQLIAIYEAVGMVLHDDFHIIATS